ncbi:MAG: uroporphyrinogen-III synthase, partial [Actinobacteria bacterium]|nr:uroporphyrinogen-III synthase [Actinomycetota bacterium]
KVLLCTAEETRDVLTEGLRARGWQVDVAIAYRTVPAAVDRALLEAIAAADVVAFASSSAVNGFAAAVPRDRWPRVAAAIGPISAATARSAGFAEVIEANRHDIGGLVDTIVDWSVKAPPA